MEVFRASRNGIGILWKRSRDSQIVAGDAFDEWVVTSIFKHLCARPSHDLILRARQPLTRRWWRVRQQYS
jgi:hypothetical protein